MVRFNWSSSLYMKKWSCPSMMRTHSFSASVSVVEASLHVGSCVVGADPSDVEEAEELALGSELELEDADPVELVVGAADDRLVTAVRPLEDEPVVDADDRLAMALELDGESSRESESVLAWAGPLAPSTKIGRPGGREKLPSPRTGGSGSADGNEAWKAAQRLACQ